MVPATFVGAFGLDGRSKEAARGWIDSVFPAGHRALHESDGWLIAADEVGELGRDGGALRFAVSGYETGPDEGAAARLAKRGADGALADAEGSFLLALWDPVRGVGTLARDRSGTRELFFTQRQGVLYFADHYAALCLLGEHPVRRGALIEWLHYGAPLAPRTFFEDIDCLGAGESVRRDDRGALHCERYWDPLRELDGARLARERARSIPELEAALDSQLRAAVRRFCEGRKRTTVLLSGGVDSGIAAALAREFCEVDALTIDVADPRAESELPLARRVAERIGARQIVSTVDRESFRGAFCDTVWTLGRPPIVESAVALEHAAASGAYPAGQRVIAGEGADAIFGGSVGLFRFELLALLLERVLGTPTIANTTRGLRRGLDRLGLRTSIPSDPRGLDWQLGARGMERGLRLREITALADRCYEPRERAVAKQMLADLDGHLEPLVTRLSPLVGRAGAGMQLALPFLERELMAFGLNLPLDTRFRWRRGRPMAKWLLKRVGERYMPKDILWAPKGGFAMPGGAWIAGLPECWVRDSWVASQFGIREPALRAWLAQHEGRRDAMFLAGLEVWGRLFALRQPLDQVREQWGSAPARPIG